MIRREGEFNHDDGQEVLSEEELDRKIANQIDLSDIINNSKWLPVDIESIGRKDEITEEEMIVYRKKQKEFYVGDKLEQERRWQALCKKRAEMRQKMVDKYNGQEIIEQLKDKDGWKKLSEAKKQLEQVSSEGRRIIRLKLDIIDAIKEHKGDLSKIDLQNVILSGGRSEYASMKRGIDLKKEFEKEGLRNSVEIVVGKKTPILTMHTQEDLDKILDERTKQASEIVEQIKQKGDLDEAYESINEMQKVIVESEERADLIGEILEQREKLIKIYNRNTKNEKEIK